MDRRGFLKSLVGGLAVGAAVRTWPFRVYSFPSEIVVPEVPSSMVLDQLNEVTYKYLTATIPSILFTPSPLYEALAREKGWRQ